MAIERGGDNIATVKKALVGIRDRFSIDLADGSDLKREGQLRRSRVRDRARWRPRSPEISKKWFRVRETYGVEIGPDQDVPLLLAVTVCIDALTSPDLGD